MRAAEFRRLYLLMGYGDGRTADKYIAAQPIDHNYTEADFEAAYHMADEPIRVHGHRMMNGGYTTKRYGKDERVTMWGEED